MYCRVRDFQPESAWEHIHVIAYSVNTLPLCQHNYLFANLVEEMKCVNRTMRNVASEAGRQTLTKELTFLSFNKSWFTMKSCNTCYSAHMSTQIQSHASCQMFYLLWTGYTEKCVCLSVSIYSSCVSQSASYWGDYTENRGPVRQPLLSAVKLLCAAGWLLV